MDQSSPVLSAVGDHGDMIRSAQARIVKVRLLQDKGINGIQYKAGAILEVSADAYEQHPDGWELVDDPDKLVAAVKAKMLDAQAALQALPPELQVEVMDDLEAQAAAAEEDDDEEPPAAPAAPASPAPIVPPPPAQPEAPKAS